MTSRTNAAGLARSAQALAHAKRIAAAIEGITGVDFGVAYKSGRRTSRTAIRFHVEQKRHPAVLAAGQRLPTHILGFPCDVMQAKYSLHDSSVRSPHGAFDPICPGISIGNLQRTTTGTLGAIVRDAAHSGTPCILSNWHVLCASVQSAAGEPIGQPGSFDAGDKPARVVGKLARWGRLDHGYDCAVATIEENVKSVVEALGLGVAFKGVTEPALHMKVVKSGIASGVTHAIVDGLQGSYRMDYSGFGDAVRFMDGIHLVTDQDHPDQDISLDGDSGSIWIDPSTDLAVALHFAGEEGLGPLADYALAHPLGRVFEILNVTFN